MTANRLLPVLLVIWVPMMFGALQIRAIPDGVFGSSHTICGPWGCGPPTKALVTMHAFWFAALLPPVVFAVLRLPTRAGWWLGVALVAAGVAGLLGIAAWDYTHWWRIAGDSHREYAAQRYLFVLATFVDAPMVQSLLGGVTALEIAVKRNRRQQRMAGANADDSTNDRLVG